MVIKCIAVFLCVFFYCCQGADDSSDVSSSSAKTKNYHLNELLVIEQGMSPTRFKEWVHEIDKHMKKEAAKSNIISKKNGLHPYLEENCKIYFGWENKCGDTCEVEKASHKSVEKIFTSIFKDHGHWVAADLKGNVTGKEKLFIKFICD
jgi:hypothetical protein